VLCCVIVCDVFTLGLPCACYAGLGTAVLGCYTRTLVRFRYRLDSNGARDLVAVTCCPQFAATQHQKELEKEGVVYPPQCRCAMT
jgi:hypothetical protein